jgi:hypothetical protein
MDKCIQFEFINMQQDAVIKEKKNLDISLLM